MSDAGRAQPTCPFCRSDKVVTDPKKHASSYLRCAACGEVWHPDRVQRAQQHLGRARWPTPLPR
jgi:hypothetical protein